MYRHISSDGTRLCGLALAMAVSLHAQSTWDFQPSTDDFSSASLLDLRHLNEQTAGEKGFVQLDGNGGLTYGDGSPARFWCISSDYAERGASLADVEHHNRWLAKRGVNMVRFHGDFTGSQSNPLNISNTSERDGLFKQVAAGKKYGVYTCLSFWFILPCESQSSWDIAGYDGETVFALLFFNENLQRYYKNWARQVLTTTNPYTGITLANDPGLAIIEFVNEDSFLFGTMDGIKPEQRAILQRIYAEWLVAKHGSLPNAVSSWGNATHPSDDIDGGEIYLLPLQSLCGVLTGDRDKRLQDQLEFYTTKMRAFYDDMMVFFRDSLGCGQILSANTWKVYNTLKLFDAERYAYTATQMVGNNHYFSQYHWDENGNQGWAITNGDRFDNESVLWNPRTFPFNMKQPQGLPCFLTEGLWVPPINWHSEAPFLAAAYQSLTGVDGCFWFNAGEREWYQPQSANGYLPSLGKWVSQTPSLFGGFPAAALVYRNHYVQQGPPAVFEHRSLESIWKRENPVIAEDAGYDPNRDAQPPAGSGISGTVSPYAYQVGPVVVQYDSDPALSSAMDMSSLVDTVNKRVTSATGELHWDWARGVCTMNSPYAQGATGFLGAYGTVELADVRIQSTDFYATVSVVSRYGGPIAQAGYVLAQVGTSERPTNWAQTRISLGGGDSAYEVTSYGEAPWKVRRSNVQVQLRNSTVTEAVVLDMNGMPVSTQPLTSDNGWVQITVPGDRMYALFRNPSVDMRRAQAATATQRIACRAIPGGIQVSGSLRAPRSVEVLALSGRRVSLLRPSADTRTCTVLNLAPGVYTVRIHDTGLERREAITVGR
jgi:hypothetical protein